MKKLQSHLLLSIAVSILSALTLNIVRADTIYIGYGARSNPFSNTIRGYVQNGQGYLFTSDLDDPFGMAFDATGNLFVANYNNDTIMKFTSDVNSVFAHTQLNPIALAFDGSGNLFEGGTTSAIEKFTPDGSVSVFGSVQSAFGLAFDAEGNLYASDYLANTIHRFTPQGVRSVFASSGLNQPYGLTFDRMGNLFVANYGDNTISKFTPDGVGSVFATTPTAPQNLAFDSGGNLFVTICSFDYNAVIQFPAAGGSSVFLDLGTNNAASSIAIQPGNLPASQASPILSINALGGGLAQVTWSTNRTDYTLEAVSDMSVGTWQVVTNVVIVSGSSYSVTVRNEAAARFFRLHKN